MGRARDVGLLVSIREAPPARHPRAIAGRTKEPDLPLFLQAFTWVDLRRGLRKEGLARLERGIIAKSART